MDKVRFGKDEIRLNRKHNLFNSSLIIQTHYNLNLIFAKSNLIYNFLQYPMHYIYCMFLY